MDGVTVGGISQYRERRKVFRLLLFLRFFYFIFIFCPGFGRLF